MTLEEAKEFLPEFNGFESNENMEASKERLEQTKKKQPLVELCEILDLPHSGSMEAIIERIMTFLNHPKGSDNAKKGSISGKASKKSASSKSGTKDDEKKRGRSAYILWSKDHRAKLVAEETGLTPQDVIRRLAEMWKEQPEAVKAKYQAMSDAERGVDSSAAKVKPPPKKRVKKEIELTDEQKVCLLFSLYLSLLCVLVNLTHFSRLQRMKARIFKLVNDPANANTTKREIKGLLKDEGFDLSDPYLFAKMFEEAVDQQ